MTDHFYTFQVKQFHTFSRFTIIWSEKIHQRNKKNYMTYCCNDKDIDETGSRYIKALSASKLRGPGFKSWLGTVGHYNNMGCSARLEISFEPNPVSESK